MHHMNGEGHLQQRLLQWHATIGMTALHLLRIAEFKFTHNFIICDQLPEMELIFGI